MSYTTNKSGTGQVELTITVTPEEYRKNMEAAAVRLSERAAIKGFRPGKAPYDIVKEQLGEAKILEEALESIVEKSYFEAVQAEKLTTLGMPKISVEKIAPGNDLVYKATVALLPKITLPELDKIKVAKGEAKITDERVDEVLNSLKKMQPQEKNKDGIAAVEDKIVIDMDMFLDKVALEGGQAKDHQVYLSEEHYIPGLKEQLLGLKKDDTKEFTLLFPKEHYQKNYAGKNVDFKIKVKDVFSLDYPEINDDFAKKLGQESLIKLREILKANLKKEAENKEEQKLEIAILEELISKSEFTDLPEVLINNEKQKMFYELKHDLEHRGVSVEQYLKDLKKTEEEIFKDFTEQATKRAKAALISREVAKANNIRVEKKELEEEVKIIKSTYADDPKVEENLKRPEVLDTIAMTIQNKKVMAWLKEKILKDS